MEKHQNRYKKKQKQKTSACSSNREDCLHVRGCYDTLPRFQMTSNPAQVPLQSHIFYSVVKSKILMQNLALDAHLNQLDY